MPWSIIVFMVVGISPCAMLMPVPMDAAGSDTATSINHANKAMTRIKREAWSVRMEKGGYMAGKLIPVGISAQWPTLWTQGILTVDPAPGVRVKQRALPDPAHIKP
jgi:hypothetical protein